MGNLSLSIFYSCQLEAAENVLTESEEYFYRKITRWYSEKFSMPLMSVRRLPMPDVLLEYYESMLENMEYNEVYEWTTANLLPEFITKQAEIDAEFEEALIKEQAKTLEAKAKRESAKKPKPPVIKPVNMTFDDEDNDE